MRQERKALEEVKINGSLCLYSPNSLKRVTENTTCHGADRVTLSEHQLKVLKGIPKNAVS